MLFENFGSHENGFLRIFVREPSGRPSVGARVVLFRMDGISATREVISTSNFLGQSEYVAHFGLGMNLPAAYSHVEVHWPHTGQSTRVNGVTAFLSSQHERRGAMLQVVRPDSNLHDTVVMAASIAIDLPFTPSSHSDENDDTSGLGSKETYVERAEVQTLDVAARRAREEMPGAFRGLFQRIVTMAMPAKQRSISGEGNNADHPSWGRTGSSLIRLTSSGYDDEISSPSGPGRPSARLVSNVIFHQNTSIESKRRLNDMYVLFL